MAEPCHLDEAWQLDGHFPCRYFVAYAVDTTLGVALAIAIHKGFLRICTALAAAAPHNPTKLWQLIVDCGNYGQPQPLHHMNGWMSSWLCTALLMDGNSCACDWEHQVSQEEHCGHHWRRHTATMEAISAAAGRVDSRSHTVKIHLRLSGMLPTTHSLCMAQTSACHTMAGNCT